MIQIPTWMPPSSDPIYDPSRKDKDHQDNRIPLHDEVPPPDYPPRDNPQEKHTPGRGVVDFDMDSPRNLDLWA